MWFQLWNSVIYGYAWRLDPWTCMMNEDFKMEQCWLMVRESCWINGGDDDDDGCSSDDRWWCSEIENQGHLWKIDAHFTCSVITIHTLRPFWSTVRKTWACPSPMALHLAIVFHWFHHQSNRREEYLLVDISTGKLMFRRRTKGGHLAWSPPHGSFKIQRFQEDVNRVSLCLRSFHCTGYHLYVRDHVFRFVEHTERRLYQQNAATKLNISR